MSFNATKNKANDWNKKDGPLWLKKNWPNVRMLDHDWTMERYDYPHYVRQYIKENWITVSNKNGGTYAEPVWFATKQKS